MDEANHRDATWVAEKFAAMRSAIGAVVIGQDEAVRLSFVTLLCSGHSLYEGVPGVAKTLLVRTLAATLGIRFGRIQCTPDLMPTDIIGTPILDARAGDFRFRQGPLFTDLLLVDEINRAPAKTQAALLEAMQERSATVDGVSYPLGEWFTVLATQNPIEQEGTYPLPEAELDRFLFKIRDELSERRRGSAHPRDASCEPDAARGFSALLNADDLGRGARDRRRHPRARGDPSLRGGAGARDARASRDFGRRVAARSAVDGARRESDRGAGGARLRSARGRAGGHSADAAPSRGAGTRRRGRGDGPRRRGRRSGARRRGPALKAR